MVIKSEVNISIVEASDLIEIFFQKLRDKKYTQVR